MEFTDDDWMAIERACRRQAQRELEHEAAEELIRIANEIEAARRERAARGTRCAYCED